MLTLIWMGSVGVRFEVGMAGVGGVRVAVEWGGGGGGGGGGKI